MKLSVIVPVYNAERFLTELFVGINKSIRNDMEIILINDGSVDNSKKLCLEFKGTRDNIYYYEQQNGGVSMARNNGINYANGEWIMFIDSDDFISNDYFEAFYRNFDDSDFIMTGYSVFENINEVVLQKKCFDFSGTISEFMDIVDSVLHPPYLLCPWGKAFKKQIIDSYDIRFPNELRYGEDVVFVLKYLMHTTSVRCFQSASYWYRQSRTTSLSGSFDEKMFDSDMVGSFLLRDVMRGTKCSREKVVFENKVQRDFILYTERLMKNAMSYRDAKKIFYEKVKTYDLISLNWKKKKKSIYWVGIVVRNKFLFPILLLLKFL